MARKSVLLASGLLLVAACADSPTAPGTRPGITPNLNQGREAPLHAVAKGRIPDEYIVVLNDGVSPDSVVATTGKTAKHVYRSSINGFAMTLTQGELQRLRRDERIKYIAENGRISKVQGVPPGGTQGTLVGSPDQLWSGVGKSTQQSVGAGLWGIDRLDRRTGWGLIYGYTDTGAGVNVYMFDSGGNFGHNDFDGLASNRYIKGKDFVTPGGTAADCDGHGTHTGGTVGGTIHGVAKGVKLYAVRVLDCYGNGTWDQFIAGVDWLNFNGKKPAVVNASMGGGYYQAANDAVNKSVLYGFTWVVSAGNSADDACYYSPASAANAITVAAMNSSDYRSTFSNYGPCVDLYAPGEYVQSAYIGSATATAIFDGTSMAAPHVAGVAALFLKAKTTATPGEVLSVLRKAAFYNEVYGNVGSTPNVLVGTQHGSCAATGPGQCYNFDGNTYFPDNDGTGYYWSMAGVQRVWLRGTVGMDVNLYYDEWNGSSWIQKAAKTSTSNNEFLQYTSTCNNYYDGCFKRVRVQSALGTGQFNLWFDWQ